MAYDYCKVVFNADPQGKFVGADLQCDEGIVPLPDDVVAEAERALTELQVRRAERRPGSHASDLYVQIEGLESHVCLPRSLEPLACLESYRWFDTVHSTQFCISATFGRDDGSLAPSESEVTLVPSLQPLFCRDVDHRLTDHLADTLVGLVHFLDLQGLVRRLDHTDTQMRKAAIDALTQFATSGTERSTTFVDPGVVHPLTTVLQSDPDMDVRLAAAEAIFSSAAGPDPLAAASLLQSVLHDSTWRVRMAGLRFLQKVGDTVTARELGDQLDAGARIFDGACMDGERVRSECVRSLRAKARDLVEYLTQHVSDSHP